MKQFDKWWREERSMKEVIAELGESIYTQGQVLDALAALAWKAALEWALSLKFPDYNGLYIDAEDVKEELKK